MHLAELGSLCPYSCHIVGHGNRAVPQKQTSLQLDPFKNTCTDATNAVMNAHVEFISSAHLMSGGAGCSDRFISTGFDFKLRLLRALLCVREGKSGRWMLGNLLWIVTSRAAVTKEPLVYYNHKKKKKNTDKLVNSYNMNS